MADLYLYLDIVAPSLTPMFPLSKVISSWKFRNSPRDRILNCKFLLKNFSLAIQVDLFNY